MHDRAYTGRPLPAPWRKVLPETAITLVKDIHRFQSARKARDVLYGPWLERPPQFVWQRHELYHSAGLRLAQLLSRPFVLSVHSLAVREAHSWGVRRPGWTRLAEWLGETRIMQKADLLACVSNEVAERVQELGIAPERIVVTPNGVDLEHFRPDIDGASVRLELGLQDRFVVGWSGSFRAFHGLDTALHAVATLQRKGSRISLLLVGDGLGRPHIERLARELKITDIRFTGAVPYEQMPRYIAAMDVALTLARPGEVFHYSPVKLREYMACGRPVIANPAGEIGRIMTDGEDALLPPSGDHAALAHAIEALMLDSQLAESLGTAALSHVRRVGSWSAQVRVVLSALRRLGHEVAA